MNVHGRLDRQTGMFIKRVRDISQVTSRLVVIINVLSFWHGRHWLNSNPLPKILSCLFSEHVTSPFQLAGHHQARSIEVRDLFLMFWKHYLWGGSISNFLDNIGFYLFLRVGTSKKSPLHRGLDPR